MLPGWVDTRCYTLHVRGLKVMRNVDGIHLGPCPPPAQAGAAKFGSVLSSFPYLVLQVIRLTHKGGCGPLTETKLPQTMVSARSGDWRAAFGVGKHSGF